jgi:hypothetical protein
MKWLSCSYADVLQYHNTPAENPSILVIRYAILLYPMYWKIKIHEMWDFSFSQQWRLRLKFCAMWCWVVGCTVPDISKDCAACVLTVGKWEKTAWCLRHTTRPATRKCARTWKMDDRGGKNEGWYLAQNFATVTCDVITAVLMMIQVFWDLTPQKQTK